MKMVWAFSEETTVFGGSHAGFAFSSLWRSHRGHRVWDEVDV
jgi:hypothetical protein